MKSEFKEVGRYQITDTTEVVVSEMVNGSKSNGISFTKYVTSERFSGWGHGIMIPYESLAEVLCFIPSEYLEEALSIQKAQKED